MKADCLVNILAEKFIFLSERKLHKKRIYLRISYGNDQTSEAQLLT